MTTFKLHSRYIWCEATRLEAGKYVDDSIALQAFGDMGEGFEEPLSTLTVCLAEYDEKPLPGHVFIKSYSENEGVLEALIAAEIVGPSIREIPVGGHDAIAHECKLLVEL